MTTYRLTCCGEAVSVGCEGAYADLPPLQHWLGIHAGHPLQVEALHPEPLPPRVPQRKRVAKCGLQPELFALPRREPGAGG